MLFVTRNFVVDRTAGALELMRQDGVTGVRAWALLLWYLWVRPGMFRKIAGAWVKFFLPGFHPWNEDDRTCSAPTIAVASERSRREGEAARPRPPAPRPRPRATLSSPKLQPHQARRHLGSPRAQHMRGATIPSGTKPSFSSTRAERGLSTKCDPSRLGSPSARAMSTSAMQASVA